MVARDLHQGPASVPGLDPPGLSSAPSPSTTLPPKLPTPDSALAADYSVISSAGKAFNDELYKFQGNYPNHDGNNPPYPGSYGEFENARMSGGFSTDLGGYPAAQGLQTTCNAAVEIIDKVYNRHYFFRWAEMGDILTAVATNYVKTEDDLKSTIEKVLGNDEARGWYATAGPLAAPYMEAPAGKDGQEGLGYYEAPIRAECKAGFWGGGYEELYRTIHAMNPKQTEHVATVYYDVANRIQASREVLYTQANNLAKSWHGDAAVMALTEMQRLYGLGGQIIDAAWDIARAYTWHSEKQAVWQKAVKPEGWWWEFINDYVETNSTGDQLKAAIQQQTVDTNNAFPFSVAAEGTI